jgi:NADH:ubiquinone oxidoreductase subunit E
MSCENCNETTFKLTEKFPHKTTRLEEFIESLPLYDDRAKNRGFLIETLHFAQDLFSYLDASIQVLVAQKLGLHVSEIYSVISFYSYFTDQPVGRFKINICTGTACFVKGADKLLDEFKRYLHIDEGETTDDQKFSLGGLRCIGACGLAPVVVVNDKVYGHVSAKQIPDIIAECVDDENANSVKDEIITKEKQEVLS